MLVFVFLVLTLGLVTSLLPFIYPDTIMNALGAYLNVVVGEFLVTTLRLGKGSLVDVANGTYALNLGGVMAVYGTPLILILLVLRGR
ncbi:MAG TPA: hypothetical protein VGW35_12050 [Methylomirabilota bacterium]|nr:hypothetical protein [Methylomirabilota bacterium]